MPWRRQHDDGHANRRRERLRLPTPAATVEGVSDLAHDVVEIIDVDSSGNPVWSGSGTLTHVK